MNTKALPYVTVLGFMFGSTLVISRFSVGQFAATTYIGLRLLFAALGYLSFYLLFSKRFKWPKDKTLWKHAIFLGAMGTALPMTLIVSSLQYLSSGIASILLTTGPAITVILAHIFLADEKLSRSKVGGVVVALAGAAVLTLSGESGLSDVSKANPWAYVMLLTAVLIGNASAIYIRKYLSRYQSYDVASIRMFTATLIVLPLSILLIGFDLSTVTVAGYSALFYAALVGTFGGMLLSVYNIKRFGATASAMTAYIIPMVSVILGALLLDETITAVMLIGMGMIIGGVIIINRNQRALAQAPIVQPVAGD